MCFRVQCFFFFFQLCFEGKVCGARGFLLSTSSDLGASCLPASESIPIFYCGALLAHSRLAGTLCMRVNTV